MKNPIVEIICQITFGNDIIKKWDTAFSYHLYEKIKNEFPIINNDKELNFNIQVDPDTNRIQHKISDEVISKFLSEDSQKTILLGNHFCAFALNFNTHNNYTNWQTDFLPHLKKLWDNLQSIIPFSSFYSLGVRYVNKIIPEKYHLDMQDIINPNNDYLPKNFMQQDSIHHAELAHDSYKKIAINSIYKKDDGFLILDIDSISEHITLSENRDIFDIVNNTQRRVEECFFNIISSQLTKQIRGADV